MYALASIRAYVRGVVCKFRWLLQIIHGQERVFNPLPLYHVNSGTVSTMAMMLTGGCQIQPDRFHPKSWWHDVNETKASIIHYLGVVAPMLLNQPKHLLKKVTRSNLALERELNQVCMRF